MTIKHQTLIIPILALSSLLTGCVGTGPNTQRGAVAGGALGAVIGAIAGNNSRGLGGFGGAILGAEVGALAGGTIGNSVDHQNGTIYGGYQQAYASRIEQSGPPPIPPPLETEVVSTAPTPEALWIPGYWSFNGQGYVWVGGRWEVPPPNVRSFVTAHWERRGGAYVWVESYWQ